jgi:hypothetical protein
MSERPYVWHEGRFGARYCGSDYPWSVSWGKPQHVGDWVQVAGTLSEAFEKALAMANGQVVS